MALLERVTTLLRANLNDLLDKAEDPEKLSKQILLDMENQLLQVKTQVAIAIADQHRLLKQQKEHEEAQAQWRRKAELAVSKGQDDLARAALERSVSHDRLAQGFTEQLADQASQAETLRTAYSKLQGKLAETRARVELLLSQHRRNRALMRATPARPFAAAAKTSTNLSRLASSVAAEDMAEQMNRTIRAMASSESMEERFQSLEQNDQIEALLLDLKQNQMLLRS